MEPLFIQIASEVLGCPDDGKEFFSNDTIVVLDSVHGFTKYINHFFRAVLYLK